MIFTEQCGQGWSCPFWPPSHHWRGRFSCSVSWNSWLHWICVKLEWRKRTIWIFQWEKYTRFLDHGFYINFFFLVYSFSFASVWQQRALWQSGTDLNCNLATPPNPGFLSQQSQYSILSLCAEEQGWSSENSCILEIHGQVSLNNRGCTNPRLPWHQQQFF